MTGDVLLTAIQRDDGSSPVRIDRADPVVRIAGQLLDSIYRGEGEPWYSMTDDWHAVVTIRGCNRTVVYVLDGDSFDPMTNTWLMRWPD